ncbi:hypothetical protein LTR28_008818, partial [Elasticomyces elasticus]
KRSTSPTKVKRSIPPKLSKTTTMRIWTSRKISTWRSLRKRRLRRPKQRGKGRELQMMLKTTIWRTRSQRNRKGRGQLLPRRKEGTKLH